jgi:nucleoside 2-deoxyribosyltransferase
MVVAEKLRSLGWTVFDDWQAAGPEADDYWQRYETARGHNMREALEGHAARHVYNHDKAHLDSNSAAILVLPAGKSGHLELGYMIGQGKPGYILMDKEPERFDVMYKFATGIFYSIEEMAEALK